jgi:hypothetical protein
LKISSPGCTTPPGSIHQSVDLPESLHGNIPGPDKLLLIHHIRYQHHGPASSRAREDLQLTRDYLVHLRQTMGEAARNLEPFDEAYAKADWTRFEHLPLFRAANRINAYNTYLLMERSGP